MTGIMEDLDMAKETLTDEQVDEITQRIALLNTAKVKMSKITNRSIL